MGIVVDCGVNGRSLFGQCAFWRFLCGAGGGFLGGKLPVAAQLGGRGIAELLGGRVAKQVVLDGWAVCLAGSVHVVFPIGRQLGFELAFLAKQHKAEDSQQRGNRNDGDGDDLHDGTNLVHQVAQKGVVVVDDGGGFGLCRHCRKPRKIQLLDGGRRVRRACRVVGGDGKLQLLHAVQLIDDGVIRFALLQLVVGGDRSEQRQLRDGGVGQRDLRIVADGDLELAAQLAVGVVIGVDKLDRQGNIDRFGIDEGHGVVHVGVGVGKRTAQAIDARHMELHLADDAAGYAVRHGERQHLALRGRQVERFVHGGVDLVVKLQAGHRLVALVGDGDGVSVALAVRRIGLHRDGDVQYEGRNGERGRRRCFHLALPRRVAHDGAKRQVGLAHDVLDGHGERFARQQDGFGQLDRRGASRSRVGKRQSAHVEFGVVGDGVGDGKRLVCSHQRGGARGGHRQFGRDEPRNRHRRGRVALCRCGGRIAQFVRRGGAFLPRQAIGDGGIELRVLDRDVLQRELAVLAAQHHNGVVQHERFVLVAARQLGAVQRVRLGAAVMQREGQIRNRPVAFQLGGRVGCDGEGDGMLGLRSRKRPDPAERACQQKPYENVCRPSLHSSVSAS